MERWEVNIMSERLKQGEQAKNSANLYRRTYDKSGGAYFGIYLDPGAVEGDKRDRMLSQLRAGILAGEIPFIVLDTPEKIEVE